MSDPHVNLNTLCRGAASELFERELQKVLENIADPNMPAKGKRSVSLVVELYPDESRDKSKVIVRAHSTLVKRSGAATELYLGKRDGKQIAVEYDPRQPGLFDEEGEETKLAAVEPFERTAEGDSE